MSSSTTVSSRPSLQFPHSRVSLRKSVQTVDRLLKMPRKVGETEERYLQGSYLLTRVRVRLEQTPPHPAIERFTRSVEIEYARQKSKGLLERIFSDATGSDQSTGDDAGRRVAPAA